jgi:peptidoglycan/xylan/chitin deacetylase (PgdA/CDA1 family)
MSIPIAVTVDIHPNDEAVSIRRCHEFLSERNIPATFLISTSIFLKSEEREAIKYMSEGPHELGTHGHRHDLFETRALISGNNGQLEFLQSSKGIFEDFLGYSPFSFRSPAWCGLGPAAIEELARLGYRVDCSATPQRPGILSSYPLKNPWLLAARHPAWLREGLLEIPTSTFLLPLASPSFAMLRRNGSQLLLNLLMLEAKKSKDMVLVLSFDVHDFDMYRVCGKATIKWRHLIPLASGGLQWRHWLRTYNPEEVYRNTVAIFERLEKTRFVRLSDIYLIRLRERRR